MSPLAIILIIIVVLMLFSAPTGIVPYTANWSYAPSGLLGLVLVVVLVLLLLGHRF